MSALGAYRALVSHFVEEVFVPIACYVDESGTHDATGEHDGAEACVVAGLVAEKGYWDTFTVKWLGVLARYNVEVFHMVDFANEERCKDECESPYHGWTRQKRVAFIDELIPIIRDNTRIGVGGLIDVRAYHELAPDRDKTHFGHPYHICFQLFFDALMNTIRTRFSNPFPANESIQCFFDQQEEFEARALSAFATTRAAGDNARYLGGISFQPKETYVPLQAADLVAFRMRKVFTRIIEGKRGINPDSWDDVLGKRGHILMRYIDRAEMERWAASGGTGRLSSEARNIPGLPGPRD